MDKIIYTSILIGACCINTFAQPIDREVLVTKDYVPVIQDAKRITIQPDIHDSIQIKPGFQYRIYPIPAKTSFGLKPIKAARLTGIPVSELYNYQVMAGIGNHHIPVLNIQANNLRSNNYLVGAMLDLNNNEGRVKLENGQKINASRSSLKILGYGKRFLDDFTLEGNVGVDLQKSHFYGLSADTVFEPLPKGKDLKQNYNTFFASAGFISANADAPFLASLKINEQYTRDRFEFFENDMSVNLATKAKVKFFDFHLDLDLQALNNNFLGDSSLNSSYFGVSPYIGNFQGDFMYSIGMNLIFESVDGNTNAYLYPKASIEYAIAGPVLSLYFSLDGKYYPNTYKNILDVNPHIKPGTQVKASDNRLRAQGGLKGSITKNLSYNISGELSNTGDYALYVIDTIGAYDNYYKVVYGDLDMIRVGGTLEYNLKNKFNFTLSGNKYTYDAGEQPYAWHLPGWEAGFALSYNMQDKVTFSGDLGVVGKRFVRDLGGQTLELKPFGVFDLKVDYHFSKALSAFLNLKNLNAAQYDTWYQYPYFKTMVVIGGVYRF